MLGSIIGDIIGSTYEFNPTKDYNFQLFTPKMTFTDDSVLTCAVIESLLDNIAFDKTIHTWGNKYPGRGYGLQFSQWLASDNPLPYNSFGNGSAMRVSPIGLVLPSRIQVLKNAKLSAEVTHNHPEGIKGAQAVALAIHLGCQGVDKTFIKKEIENEFKYDLSKTYKQIQPTYKFNETCQGSVPESLIAFFESTNFESAIRLAISLGGDADTQACIAGSIAEAYYKEIPQEITDKCLPLLTADMKKLIKRLYKNYKLNKGTLADRMESEGFGDNIT
ncbi:MAG: ADP-ribosylglycohydrolase family protein [Bacteroidota bacterium]